ncbi:hypothetical protein [Sinorhizobium fredii]|uniref:hypothetical protein n=1 Tax=Rhizobium fredii TaxID=380 RepID=UPI003517343A
MRRFGIVLGLVLAGCTTSEPYLAHISGNYYLGGDSNCTKFDVASPTRIKCYNSKMEATGYRDAMTQQQLQMYAYQKAAQAQRQQAAAYQYEPQPMPVISYPQMQTPQVTPITPPGGNQVRCLSTGFYTNCRY